MSQPKQKPAVLKRVGADQPFHHSTFGFVVTAVGIGLIVWFLTKRG